MFGSGLPLARFMFWIATGVWVWVLGGSPWGPSGGVSPAGTRQDSAGPDGGAHRAEALHPQLSYCVEGRWRLGWGLREVSAGRWGRWGRPLVFGKRNCTVL